MKQHWKNEEFRKRAIKKGKDNPMYGKTFNHTEETKKKISLAGKGRKCSDEARKNMSLARKGKPLSEKHRMALKMTYILGRINPNKGKPMSEEQKEKISLANLKHWEGKRKKKKRSYHSTNRKYKLWRSSVFERDNWICQRCGKKKWRREDCLFASSSYKVLGGISRVKIFIK